MLYKGQVIPKDAISVLDAKLIYSYGSFSKLNGKEFTNIDTESRRILTEYLVSLSNKMSEYDTFHITDEAIIKILNKEYFDSQHFYDDKNTSYEKIIYEKVEDEDGNLYAKELLTGSLFPIANDGTTKVKEYTVEKIMIDGFRDYCDLSISLDYDHENYARIERIVANNNVASPNEVEAYKTQFDGGFRLQNAKEKFIRKIELDSKSNTLISEIEVFSAKPKKQEKRKRESQNQITKSMENIEYLIQKLKKINPTKSKEFTEEYECILQEEDMMGKKTISSARIINLEAKLEFELMFTKGENTSLVDKLEELKREYLEHFIIEAQEKTSITLDDLDKLMELFLKTKDSYSILEQRKILRNFASVYALEVKENENNITIQRLQDSYFEDLKKSILLFINALLESGYVKNNIIIELTDSENTEEILNLIKNLEFKKISLEEAKELCLTMWE